MEAIDTAAMFRAYSRDTNPTSLGRILYHFDMSGWHLHNAGNDAVYTVWAILAIAVKSASERDDPEAEKRHEVSQTERMTQAIDAAKDRGEG